jgi:hypothetical protein
MQKLIDGNPAILVEGYSDSPWLVAHSYRSMEHEDSQAFRLPRNCQVVLGQERATQ